MRSRPHAPSGGVLTTSTGVRLRDTDHSLKAGERGRPCSRTTTSGRRSPTSTTSAHPRGRSIARARRRGARRLPSAYGTANPVCKAGFLAEGRRGPRRSCGSLGPRIAWLGGHGGAPGFKHEVLHRRGHLSTWSATNIPVFFIIQDGIQVPRRRPRRQAAPGPGDPPGPERTTLGLRRFAHRAQHPRCGTRVRPRIPGPTEPWRLRRPTFRVENAAGETSLAVPLGRGWACTRSPGRGPPGSTPTSTAGTSRRDRGRRAPVVRARLRSSPTTRSRSSRASTSRPDQDGAEELAPAKAVGRWCWDRDPTNFFAETGAGRSSYVGHLGRRHRRDRRPAGAGAPVLVRRHAAHPPRRAELNQIPVNRPHAPVSDMPRRLPPALPGAISGDGAVPAVSLDGGCPFQAGSDVAGVRAPAGAGGRQARVRALSASSIYHFQPDAALLAEHVGRAGAHHRAYTFELRQVLRKQTRSRSASSGALANIDARLCAEVATDSSGSRRGADGPASGRRASPVSSQSGQVWRRTAGWSASWWTRRRPVRRRGAGRGLPAAMVPLVIGPHGGMVGPMAVQRTFATVRSVEARRRAGRGAPVPAPDALPARDAKAGLRHDERRPRVVLSSRRPTGTAVR